MSIPSYEDVRDAAQAIKGHAARTPVLEFPVLNEQMGGRVFIKPEILQRTGSFKFRGAYNRLSRLTPDQAALGVVAWSSGNHAQGVAAAAATLNVRATIVMPEDAPALKIARTKALGATIRFFNRYTDDREAIGHAIAADTGATLVPSCDDPFIIAGQGTAALELFEAIDQPLDHLLVPCGGGGLTAGTVLARDGSSPPTKIYTVEPENFDDHARSFQSGKIEGADIKQPSICDALLSPSPGKLTFQINRLGVERGLVVSEEEVQQALRFAFEELKLVIEPGGAVGLAALLSRKLETSGEPIGIILSGGNVDPDLFASII